MVVKTIVVSNLFSFEYEGSNPSLPTIKYKKTCILFFTTHTNKTLPKGEKIKFSTNKEKGNAGLGIAIAYYSTNGYTVSIPLNDTQDYDLVVDKNSCLKKVQVKATSCKTKYNKYQVALKSCGGTLGKTYKTIIDTDIDELFIVTDAMDIFIIPIKEVVNKSTINLCEKYEKFRIKYNV